MLVDVSYSSALQFTHAHGTQRLNQNKQKRIKALTPHALLGGINFHIQMPPPPPPFAFCYCRKRRNEDLFDQQKPRADCIIQKKKKMKIENFSKVRKKG